jgi:hypothetical protein
MSRREQRRKGNKMLKFSGSTFGDCNKFKSVQILADKINSLPTDTSMSVIKQISTTWNKYNIGLNEILNNIHHRQTKQHMIVVWRNEFRGIVSCSNSIPDDVKRTLDNLIVGKARVHLKQF